MAGTGDFKVAVKLHADASQYTAEFTKAGQLAQTFASTLQSGGGHAASGLQTAATAAQALGTATASGTQQASAGLAQASTAAQTLGSTLQATSTQAAQTGQGLDNLTKSSRDTAQSQQQSRAAGDALIAMLRDQIATAGKSTEELLRYRAAQSGVAAEAAPLILQLQNQRAAQEAAAAAARQEEAAQREAVAGKQRATAAQESFMAGLREQVAVSGKSAEELLHYRAAQSGVAAEAAPLIQQFQNQRAAQEAAAAAARQEEAAQREAQAAKQRAATAQDQFLAGLREEIALRGKSTTEVLQYRAAQLGVSSEAAQSIRILDDANKKGAISAGQHAAAMRMLPAQMTDVVTSIASGMPIWLVGVQQFGQIKDSFGGAGAAARAMLAAITPLAAGLAIATAAAGLAAAAYYQGSAEADRFLQVTTLNGNAAGVTTEALSRMSREIDGIYGTQSKAAEGVAVLAGSGKIARDNLAEFTTMAVKMEDLAGRSIKKTSEELEQLGTKPAEASAKLNEAYNYLTPAVYRQIQALEDQGRSEDAAALAQKTYSDAMSARADTLQGELGYVELGWRNARDLAKEAWDAFLNVGRPTTVQDKAEKHIADLEARIADRKRRAQEDGDPAWDKGTEKLQRQLDNAKAFSQLTTSAEKAVADAIDRENTARQAGIDLQREASRLATDAVKKRNELAQAEAKWLPLTKAAANASAEEVKAAADAAKDYAAVVAGIEKKYSKKGAGGISISDNQLAGLQSQLEAAKQYYEQLQTLGAGASELNTGERESLKLSEQITKSTNAKTRAKLEEAKAIADALGVQLRTNDGLEKGFKAEQQQHDAMVKGTDAIIQRAKDQEAANAVVGKGRTAIEQMTLAELEHQLAQAQGKGASDQQIADLEARIEAQKRWVGALGQADYKAVMAHADEMLRNAQELSKVYEDELALTGLTGLEREKIVAARQVELKYAKAIDAVNKGTLSDTEKEAARTRLNEARDIESANAVAKAQQNHMAKASEEINKSLTDALMRGFEAGKGFAENLADTVKNMFNTMVLRPVISAVMAPVSGAINGVVQYGLNAVGLGGGNSAMSTLNNLSSLNNLWGTASQLLTGASTGASTASLAYANGVGALGGDSLGALIAANGGWAGVGVGTAGLGVGSGIGLGAGSATAGLTLGTTAGVGTGAAGLGVGAGYGVGAGGAAAGGAAAGGSWMTGAIPLAVIAGMFMSSKLFSAGIDQNSRTGFSKTLGIGNKVETDILSKLVGNRAANILTGAPVMSYTFGSLFGRKLKDAGIEGTFGGDTGFEGRQFQYFKGGLFRSNKTKYSALDEETRSAWGSQFFALREGTTAMSETLGLSADALTGFAAKVKVSLKGLSDEEAAAEIQAEFDKIAESMAGAVLTTDEYTRADETRVQTLGRLSTHLVTANKVLDTLNHTLYTGSLAGADAASSLMDLFGGVEQFGAVTSEYFSGFFTAREQRNAAQAELAKQLAGVDLQLPDIDSRDAREQWRALAEAQDLTTESGRNAWAMLMQLSSTFAGLTQNAYELQTQREQQERDTLAKLLNDQHQLWAELAAAQGDNATAAQRRYLIETAGMTLAEQAAYDYNAAIRVQISSAQAATSALSSLSTTQWDLENQLYTLQGKDGLVAERTREKELAALLAGIEDEAKRKQITSAYDYNVALRAQIQAQQAANTAAQAQAQAAQQAADAARSLMEEWQSAADGIYDEVRRIRGLNSDNAAQSLSAAQAQLAIAQAQASAGDIDAAKSLPELSRALLTIAASSATSLIELRRIQGQTASSLQQTGDGLVSQHGLQLPSFDVGTNFVPFDMIAQIHQGEMIVPAEFNPTALMQRGGFDPQVPGLLQRILEVLDDIQHETQASAVSNAAVAKSLQRVLNPARSAFRVQEQATA